MKVDFRSQQPKDTVMKAHIQIKKKTVNPVTVFFKHIIFSPIERQRKKNSKEKVSLNVGITINRNELCVKRFQYYAV